MLRIMVAVLWVAVQRMSMVHLVVDASLVIRHGLSFRLLAEEEMEGLADLDAADDRLEVLREQARTKMADFDAVMTGGSAAPEPEVQLRKKKKPVVAPKAKPDFNPFAAPTPDVNSNRSSRLSSKTWLNYGPVLVVQFMAVACGSMLNVLAAAASSDFNDDDFMAELNRRRQERAGEEARRAEELRKQHAVREAVEQAERQKVIDEVNAQKRIEEEKERRRKVGQADIGVLGRTWL